ncbi:hypothetical protein Pla110_13400 [Polystyrenella longa]|uniref:Zinc-ribbon domain-containing protein n=1 Tax=Polystyrenella longa TaxID=2528007 RepID=A0A518CK74_9PLAN|nr:putative zinc-binding metallopeptidase [Polystyrenella longa]QDU79629.1 hypothetical protein Pla110_13400 [Polystyrenella longa]
MKTFPCTCGNTLFFDSQRCVACGIESGLCSTCDHIAPLLDRESEIRCGNRVCGVRVQKCAADQGCNRLLPYHPDNDTDELCDYCALTTVTPDLSVEGNLEKWQRLERAKRRVLCILDQAGFPFRPDKDPTTPELTFKFKADEEKPVMTGHISGCITINIKEADSVVREQARVDFGEPHRTLVGHFRHELGHYFWDRLVLKKCEGPFRELFGDERNPTYKDALDAYYKNGPAQNWPAEYVSAYSSMHPWEDFAETFNVYLDMMTVLITADNFNVVQNDLNDFEGMMTHYAQVGMIANEFNRDMGLLDLVPEVFVPQVREKLRFIHKLRLRS